MLPTCDAACLLPFLHGMPAHNNSYYGAAATTLLPQSHSAPLTLSACSARLRKVFQIDSSSS